MQNAVTKKSHEDRFLSRRVGVLLSTGFIRILVLFHRPEHPYSALRTLQQLPCHPGPSDLAPGLVEAGALFGLGMSLNRTSVKAGFFLTGQMVQQYWC